MSDVKVGIGDIGVYAPELRMDLETLVAQRAQTHPELESRLARAVTHTGQESFAFPQPWEDTASLAANASSDVMDRQQIEKGQIRYLAVGSETAVDHAKPIASYVQGMLQESGYPIDTSMTTFEVKHACAGGTTALLSTAALLGFSGAHDDKALVVCSDIARYDTPSTAEITQGAGAVAMVVEQNPRLLELDMDRHGFYASDVDDFFRPLESVTAKVKGRYSMECYQDALIGAFSDYCKRRGGTPCRLIDEMDYLALHVPFVKMPETAVRKMLKDTCGKTPEQTEEFFRRTSFLDVMDLNGKLGNLYTGSLYAYLAYLLSKEYRRLGQDIVGKKILVASYGSGNTMMVYTATVAPGAPDVISSWDMEALERSARKAEFSEYENWLNRPKNLEEWSLQLSDISPTAGQYFLKGFSDTGLRLYDRA